MKRSEEALSSRCASRVNSLPLLSSSPIDSNPILGSSTPCARRAYTDPITANCNRCCGRHSTFAPASSSTAGRLLVGIVVASAGRSTPGTMPNAACAESTAAPVCPALTSAAALRPATSSAATLTDERGLRRTADEGDSAISITSGASTTPIPSARQSGYALNARSTSAVRPTRSIPASRWRAAATAPSTTTDGA